MTRLLAAFAAGTFCGLVSMWPARTHEAARAVPTASRPDVGRASAGQAVDGLKPVLHSYLGNGSSHRNLFAFFEIPKPQPKIVVPAPEPQPIVLPQLVVAAEPAPPPFPYRYIGSFGPRDALFAAFARDGEVVNVSPGEMIGGFRLVRIGVESVEVADANRSLRVPIAR